MVLRFNEHCTYFSILETEERLEVRKQWKYILQVCHYFAQALWLQPKSYAKSSGAVVKSRDTGLLTRQCSPPTRQRYRHSGETKCFARVTLACLLVHSDWPKSKFQSFVNIHPVRTRFPVHSMQYSGLRKSSSLSIKIKDLSRYPLFSVQNVGLPLCLI
jgi:hypothetical protein